MTLSYGPFITRSIAKRSGIKLYYTGQACANGHISTRTVCNYSCSECQYIRTCKRFQINPATGSSKIIYGPVLPQKIAIKKGLTQYYTGKKCKNGHLSPRNVSGQDCIECQRLLKISARRKNPQLRITNNLRSRIWQLINKRNKLHTARWRKLLGCSVDDLKKHIENQFQAGMSWDNYGLHGWHIDHIRPCASFDLTKESERELCFHYSNLQPLWAKDNLQKSDNWQPSSVN